MTTPVYCGPCGFEDNIRNARKWCTNCQTGFCKDCNKVHRSTQKFKNHQLISISDYQKINVVSTDQTCALHRKRYELYCSIHDKPLCVECANTSHTCSEIGSLKMAATNAKHSSAIDDVEETINNALRNVGTLIKSHDSWEKDFEKQENLIKRDVQETRKKFNDQLDLLEQKIGNCKSTYNSVRNQLNFADQKISHLKTDLAAAKKQASGEMVFLRMLEINKSATQEIKSVKSIINSLKYFEINSEINHVITSLCDRLIPLVAMSVAEISNTLEYKDFKLDHAQKPVTRSSKCVIDLKLKQHIEFVDSSWPRKVSGCLILYDGHILVADFCEEKHIMEYDEDGLYIRDISCSGDPYYLALIDSDHIAVTYLSSRIMEIINIKNARVKRVMLRCDCRGISYQDGKLYVIVYNIGIVVVDLSGEILNTLQIKTDDVFDISVSERRIYYTHVLNNTVYCISLTGEHMWAYRNESIIYPRGVAVAYDQDVFVLGRYSDNISLIKRNGKESKILSRDIDKLIRPAALYYNKDRKELLVCNEGNGNAAIFTVIEDK